MTAQWQPFFDQLYGGQVGVLELRALQFGDDKPELRDFISLKDGRIDPASVQKFVNTCAAKKWNAFFGVALRNELSIKDRSGNLEHCQTLTALFVDADYKRDGETETRRKIATLSASPSLMVSTGGGLHVYWLLSRPLELKTKDGLAQARRLLKSVATHADVVDKSVSEPARILRIPGTLNYKYDPPQHVVWENAE